MSVQACNRNSTVCPVSTVDDLPFMPDDVQRNVCRYISVREGEDIRPLLNVNSVFNRHLSEKKSFAAIANEVNTAGRINLTSLKTVFQKHLSTMSGLNPESRVRLFQLLSDLVGEIRSPRRRDALYQLLWKQVDSLPASNRSDAILAMASHPGTMPYEQIGVLIDQLPQAHQPEILGLLSQQLMLCSELKFPALVRALFDKTALLSNAHQCDALFHIHENTVKSWQGLPVIPYDPAQSNEPPPLQSVQEKRCKQVIDTAKKLVAALLPDYRAMPDNLWK